MQSTLIDSQWARRYTIRASTVIAMFDPEYNQRPGAAEQRVEAVLRPPVAVQAKNRTTATLRMASYTNVPVEPTARKRPIPRSKRKLT